MKPLIFRIVLLFLSSMSISYTIDSGWDAIMGSIMLTSLLLLMVDCLSYFMCILTGETPQGSISKTLFKNK